MQTLVWYVANSGNKIVFIVKKKQNAPALSMISQQKQKYGTGNGNINLWKTMIRLPCLFHYMLMDDLTKYSRNPL